MIKSMTITITELDDEQLAVQQLLSQLNLEKDLMKHSICIIACHYEFVLSGVFKAVSKALPFDVVGSISSAQSVPDTTDFLLMTLLVLTSDDVEFDIAITESIISEQGPKQAIKDCYNSKVRKDIKPAMIFAFAAFLVQNCGDDYVTTLSEISGNVPCFGTIAVDDTYDFKNCFVLSNGEHYHDKLAMILFYGDIRPKFFVANISESKIIGPGAVITKSAGPVLMEVNGHPVIEYLSDLGLGEASESQYAMANLPLLLDYNDGSPMVSKILVMLTEDKSVICAGAMPLDSTLHIAKCDSEDVMFTTGQALQSIINEIGNASTLLVYTCISRNMALGSDHFKEMELVREKTQGKITFLMANSGGEICPTQVSDDKAINRFHNNAFVACLF